MSLLSSHLESISYSAQSIQTLPFPPPKIFTNALLAPHDITALIRDTEPHERALFSVPPPPPLPTSQAPPKPNRRQTVFNVASGEVTAGNQSATRAPRRNTAVAAVLGGELHNVIRKRDGKEVDVEVLLHGAEKLGDVFPLEGAKERIANLRKRYATVRGNLEILEDEVERQTRELEMMNGRGMEDEVVEEVEVTEEDLRREEEEIRELERRKRELEERVSGMERDLGGLLR